MTFGRHFKLLAPAMILLFFIGFGYTWGYLDSKFDVFPAPYVKKIVRKFGAPKIENTNKPSESTIETIFVDLEIVRQKVPKGRRGRGGGLTSIRDEVVLLTHDGRIFLTSPNDIKLTSLRPPDNGFQSYSQAASSKFKNLSHKPHGLRYHDILYFSSDDTQGLIVSFTEWHSDRECYDTALALLELPGDLSSIMNADYSEDDWQMIFRTQPCLPLKKLRNALEGHMAGGRIDYKPPGKVILGSGDYHWDGVWGPKTIAQDPDNDYGKVIEVDIMTGESTHLTIGHRNMQGLLVDDSNEIWTTEHGPRGGDELNLIEPGNDYGWPVEILGTRYDKLPWPTISDYGRHDVYTRPFYAWVPSIGVSNITQVENFTPSWDRDLLVSSLKALTLFRLRVRENRVIFAEPINIGQRIRYAHQHNNGTIVLWTDDGELLFVTAKEDREADELFEYPGVNSELNEALTAELKIALDDCRQCHVFGTDHRPDQIALGGIFGNEIASTPYKKYSTALSAKKGRWDAEKLEAFLSNPQEFAPGTTMPNPNIEHQDVIKRIISIIENTSK